MKRLLMFFCLSLFLLGSTKSFSIIQEKPEDKKAGQLMATPIRDLSSEGVAISPKMQLDEFKVISESRDSEHPVMLIYGRVQVRDNKGNPLTDIKTSEITIVEQEREVHPISLTPYNDPLAIIFLVDDSGSMKGEPMECSKGAIRNFSRGLSSKDKIAVIAFNEKETVVHSLSSTDGLDTNVSKLEARGKTTELFRALQSAIDLASAGEATMRYAIVVLSDGRDEGKAFTMNDVIEHAMRSNIPIYSIGIGYKNRAYLTHLERISQKTGGLYIESSNPKDIDGISDRILQYLKKWSVMRWTTLLPGDLEKKIEVRFLRGDIQAKAEGLVPSFERPRVFVPLWKQPLILSGGVLAIVILGIGIWFVMVNRKKERDLLELRIHQAREEERRIAAEAESSRTRAQNEDMRVRMSQQSELLERKCSKCGRIMDTTWSECFFCANEAKRSTSLNRKDIPIYRNAFVRFLNGPRIGEKVGLPWHGEMTIGAGSDNVLRIEEATVSGRHVKITGREGRFFIEDLHSTNGTLVGEESLAPNSLYHLSDGVRVKTGKIQFVFEGE
jgi:VWFA-related protein